MPVKSAIWQSIPQTKAVFSVLSQSYFCLNFFCRAPAILCYSFLVNARRRLRNPWLRMHMILAAPDLVESDKRG